MVNIGKRSPINEREILRYLGLQKGVVFIPNHANLQKINSMYLIIKSNINVISNSITSAKRYEAHSDSRLLC